MPSSGCCLCRGWNCIQIVQSAACAMVLVCVGRPEEPWLSTQEPEVQVLWEPFTPCSLPSLGTPPHRAEATLGFDILTLGPLCPLTSPACQPSQGQACRPPCPSVGGMAVQSLAPDYLRSYFFLFLFLVCKSFPPTRALQGSEQT